MRGTVGQFKRRYAPLVEGLTVNPLLTFARSSIAAYVDSNNQLVEVGNNVGRLFLPNGLLLEGTRTNLFLNSATPVTQDITVTAAAHTISFYGTGSITLSGAASATLNGTGANQRVSTTFTPSAGTLTVTLAGSVSLPQLELGTFASSYIPTGGASVARATETLQATPTALGISATRGFTMTGRVLLPQAAPATASQVIFQLDDNTNSVRYSLANLAGAATLRAVVNAGISSSIFTMTPGTSFGFAASVDVAAGSMSVSINGGTVVTQGSGPTSGLLTLRLGNNATGLGSLFGFLSAMRLYPVVYSTAELPALSLTV